jgi:hypothetical protein
MSSFYEGGIFNPIIYLYTMMNQSVSLFIMLKGESSVRALQQTQVTAEDVQGLEWLGERGVVQGLGTAGMLKSD